jgi:hypothetical protein
MDKTTGGIGFFGALTLIFIVLKLCNVINWSWLWVLSPLWLPFSIVMVCLVVVLIILFYGKWKW